MAFKPLTLNTPPEKAAHILAEDDAAIYEALLGDDRVLDIGNKLAATVITNNSVRISDGVAVVGGHVGRIKKGDYQDMTIENGVSGKKRNDLICARFITNGDTDTYNLVVVKGAAGTTATDPSVVKGNLYAGDKQRDFPLWRVCLDGLSITKVQQMFSVSKTNKYFSDQLDQLNRNLQSTNGSLDTLIKASDINGAAFERNFNRISFDLDNGVNKLSYFVITDASRDSWTGIPSSMPKTGVIMGYREVFRRSSENILVKITEMLPTPGKQYYNLYNAGSWTGWKTLTPQ